jgi:hypothetical protein
MLSHYTAAGTLFQAKLSMRVFTAKKAGGKLLLFHFAFSFRILEKSCSLAFVECVVAKEQFT